MGRSDYCEAKRILLCSSSLARRRRDGSWTSTTGWVFVGQGRYLAEHGRELIDLLH